MSEKKDATNKNTLSDSVKHIRDTTGNSNDPVADANHTSNDAVPGQMNLLDFLEQPRQSITPEIVRITGDELAVIPFTPMSVLISVHYVEEPEVRAYVHCIGDGCLLCTAGKHKDDRILIPVIVPTDHRIGLLMVSTSMRPGALLYQIGPHIRSAAAGDRQVIFIRRQGNMFQLSARTLRDGEDDGANLVKCFLADLEAGKSDLRQAVQTLTGDQLLAIPSIAHMLKLKGVIE